MTIVPTELITDNGAKLESYVLELAHLNNLDFRFIEWLENNNTFCNSLVDRIVPGKPNNEELVKLQASLGYEDELLIIAEAFRLWAIEGNDNVKKVLAFSVADEGVVITPDITVYKELKLRLLNGTHTLNACLAFLYGFDLTKQSVNDKTYMGFMKKLVYEEISNAIPYDIEPAVRNDFAARVLYRFANPFIDHQWLSITVQQTAKMKMRVIPLLQKHYERYAVPPIHMTICFAAYLWFMKSEKKSNGKYVGKRNGVEYEIKDDEAGYFYETWQNNSTTELAATVLRNEALWGADLAQLPMFLLSVQERLAEISSVGVVDIVNRLEATKITA